MKNKDTSFMTKNVHPTACIQHGASIHETAIVGPYCIVGENVSLGPKVELKSHVIVQGNTAIGEETIVYPFAVLGEAPQFSKYSNQPTKLVIGLHNTIREHATIHRGTEEGGGTTIIGNNGLFMVGCHIAHDCHVGNNVLMANNATLGGHVTVGDFAYIGGLAAVHPLVRIGQQSIVGGMSGVEGDVIPYGSVMGNRARLAGLNIIGMRRRGLSREDIHDLRSAYRMLFANEGTMSERLADVREHFSDQPQITEILDFMTLQKSERSFCLPKDVDED